MQNNKTIIKHGFMHAVLAVAYIAFIASLMANAETFLGRANGMFGIMAVLLIFVISAAVMGIVIFGRPIMWYLNSRKKEAVLLVFYTIGFLSLIAIIVLLKNILIFL